MENKQRLFIYDRREIVVLLFLGLLVAAFAFTLGIHLGKRVETHPAGGAPVATTENTAVETSPDPALQKQEYQEIAKEAGKNADDALNQALHDEVVRTGIKLEAQHQVDLPQKTKAEQHGAEESAEVAQPVVNPLSELERTLNSLEAVRRPFPPGDFTIEVGSTTSLQDAKDQVEALEALGLRPLLRQSKSSGKERRFRIYLGGFASQEDATAAGEKYRNQHVIDAFTVTRSQSTE